MKVIIKLKFIHLMQTPRTVTTPGNNVTASELYNDAQSIAITKVLIMKQKFFYAKMEEERRVV